MKSENFILNLYKPPSLSSTQANSRLKKHWNLKKVGHLGTLDPMAEGILPIFGGQYTKLIPYFQDHKKTYSAKIEIGASSDSLDKESPIRYSPVKPFSKQEIRQVLHSFIGTITQEAPSYSALKYKGRPLYYYALKKIEVPKKIKKITIDTIDLISYKHPILEIEVCCSKGTYIRSLARDIGQKLNSCAILIFLQRKAVGNQFTLKNSIPLDRILKKQYNADLILDIQKLLQGFQHLSLTKEQITRVSLGKKITIDSVSGAVKMEQPTFSFSEKGCLVAAGVLRVASDERLSFYPKKLLYTLVDQ